MCAFERYCDQRIWTWSKYDTDTVTWYPLMKETMMLRNMFARILSFSFSFCFCFSPTLVFSTLSRTLSLSRSCVHVCVQVFEDAIASSPQPVNAPSSTTMCLSFVVAITPQRCLCALNLVCDVQRQSRHRYHIRTHMLPCAPTQTVNRC